MIKRVALLLVLLSLAATFIPSPVRAEGTAITLPPGKRFSHSLHVVEAELDCAKCHAAIDTSTSKNFSGFLTKELCAQCHPGADDPSTYGIVWGMPGYAPEKLKPEQQIEYSHKIHLDHKIRCSSCHANLDKEWDAGLSGRIPMATCMDCHTGKQADDKCVVCHANRITLADIHPGDWRHEHGDPATTKREWCASCHKQEATCLDCHRGDNLTQNTHPLNYQFTHGLEAKGKIADCQRCHENQEFCNKCHQQNGAEPIDHLTATWKTIDHAQAAKSDIESCASCHDVATGTDMTCARSGCHNDFDGVRGTDPKIHGLSGMLTSRGPWHEDDAYYCYQCHTNTHQAGVGFCGYCHGTLGR